MSVPPRRKLQIERERWPLANAFHIARGSKESALVVVVRISQGAHEGWGECVPYHHYGETPALVVSRIEALRDAIESGLSLEALQSQLPAGAARNAIDCAMWDLTCQQQGVPVWRLANLPEPGALTTAFTISLNSPEAMANAARRAAPMNLLKVKLGADAVLPRLRAVKHARPDARIIADANESWTVEQLRELMPHLHNLGVSAIEQPLPAAADHALAGIDRTVPVCADESFRQRSQLPELAQRYDMINIKLDKSGGLSEAIHQRQLAQALGLSVMVGCMVSTSLSTAPAMLVAAGAALVDLDGGLLVAQDRPNGVRYEHGIMSPLPLLWGVPR